MSGRHYLPSFGLNVTLWFEGDSHFGRCVCFGVGLAARIDERWSCTKNRGVSLKPGVLCQSGRSDNEGMNLSTTVSNKRRTRCICFLTTNLSAYGVLICRDTGLLSSVTSGSRYSPASVWTLTPLESFR